MLVLKLCQQFCPDKIPVTVASKIGDGADGEVFDIEGQPDKVIKFSILLEGEVEPSSLQEEYQNTSDVLHFLVHNKIDYFAKVYSYQWMGEYTRIIWGNQEEKYVLYYYIMEKLKKISEDERKVFHTILSNEDREIVKNYTPAQVKKILGGLSTALDFDAERVTFFCDSLRGAPVIHLDLNVRNIMKDGAGNFKLVDFDRAEIRR
jgi:hypothetical protein